jgi:GT2 family glycosyltransferase
VKIALCIPVYGGAKPQFVRSYGRLISHTYLATAAGTNGEARPIVETFIRDSASVSHNRREIAHEALAWGADWLLWLDADMVFPPDALIRLLAHGKPIVAANYRRRDPDSAASTAARLVDGRAVPLEPGRDGLEEAAFCGFGLCLVASAVLRAMSPPLFLEGVDKDQRTAVGEDAYFFIRARASGFPCLIDHALSLEVGHIAETVLRF